MSWRSLCDGIGLPSELIARCVVHGGGTGDGRRCWTGFQLSRHLGVGQPHVWQRAVAAAQGGQGAEYEGQAAVLPVCGVLGVP